MLIDDDISAVGTANFDNRSFRLNFEVTALISDPASRRRWNRCSSGTSRTRWRLIRRASSEQPFWWRLGVDLSRLAAPVL